MKYVSILIFTAALVWTWNIIHTTSPISFETHSGIQEKLAEVIVSTIQSRRPTASDITIEKIWTEVLATNKVKAFFAYSFRDSSEAGSIKTEIRGEGLLERQEGAEANTDRWVLSHVKTTNDAIQFDEATLITGSATDSTAEESSAPPSATTPEGQKPTEKQNH